MKISIDDLSERQRSILHQDVYQLFFTTAESDYLSARILWHHYQFNSFSWLAAQCIEKLIKCSLILNGHSAKKVSHNFTSYFKSKCTYCEMLLPKQFSLIDTQEGPKTLTFFDCMNLFENIGNPNNRYNENELELKPYFLEIFDFLVFNLRRVATHIDSNTINTLENNPKLQLSHIRIPSPEEPKFNTFECLTKGNSMFFEKSPNDENSIVFSYHISPWDTYKGDPDALISRIYLRQNARVTYPPDYDRQLKKIENNPSFAYFLGKVPPHS